ncbi:MAG: SDR family oxidoreductase [Candidatus Thermoplasmatota archaeon]|nr:SDR family oxidoreductase [Candidatus Thermoplasmatota archaeon]
MTWSIRDKTVLVTGANSGIGKETARELARDDAHVLLHARREDAGQAAVDEIRQGTGNDQVELVLADLADQDQVRRLAKELNGRLNHLDVLINNAGAVLDQRYLTPQGNEQQFEVNHLAPFLLTHELLGLLRQAAETHGEARVINVASEAHWNVRKPPEALQSLTGRYSSFGVYSQTKLYNILFTQELAEQLAGTGIQAHCLHPGVIGSNFGSGGPWYVRAFMKLAGRFLTSPEEGAETTLYLATAPEIPAVPGTYFKDAQPAETSKMAQDPELQRRLWEESEALTGVAGWP